jgi:hypothetical protein
VTKKQTFGRSYVSLFENFQESESLSSGDFNGDGENEDLIVLKPEMDSSKNYLSTETKITFTNMDLPEIVLPNCVGVNVLNENDVDGDGSDDFSIVIKNRMDKWVKSFYTASNVANGNNWQPSSHQVKKYLSLVKI